MAHIYEKFQSIKERNLEEKTKLHEEGKNEKEPKAQVDIQQ